MRERGLCLTPDLRVSPVPAAAELPKREAAPHVIVHEPVRLREGVHVRSGDRGHAPVLGLSREGGRLRTGDAATTQVAG
jgi:hypothetical protein